MLNNHTWKQDFNDNVCVVLHHTTMIMVEAETLKSSPNQ